MWGRVINPLWCLKAPSPATKKWIFEFYTKFGLRNHLQTFWPRRLVKGELSLGLKISDMNDMFKVFFQTCWIGVTVYYICRILGKRNKVIKANV